VSIGIIGGGTAGLHLALFLQQRDVDLTLYAERSADEVRRGRLPNTVIHNHRTRSREKALGVNFWDESALPIDGHWHYIAGEQPLSFPGYFAAPSQGIDYRLYQPALLEAFEDRGGTAVYGQVSADDLDTLGERHDLLVVCTGRGGFGDVFPPLPDRSRFSQPARLLAAGLFTGISHDREYQYVSLCVAPPHGEFIEAPMATFDGNAAVLLFECVPGGDLERLARMPYADDPKAYQRAALEALEKYNPPVFERVDAASFELARPDSFLQGAVTPTVRRSYVKLANGTYAIALGDAHVTMDPVTGMGANAASFGAWVIGEAIVEGLPLDEHFCRLVDERRLPMVLGSFDFTGFMLQPEPHLFDLIGAMSQNRALADDFTDGFTDPPRQWSNVASAEATSAYIAGFTATPA
jgi:2-polyprenyl-6-methoxyphenol hydroxylase-like FAD-dependent oxidoreductase